MTIILSGLIFCDVYFKIDAIAVEYVISRKDGRKTVFAVADVTGTVTLIRF